MRNKVPGRVLNVSKSGYYAWLKRLPSPRARDNARLEVAIQAAHVRTRASYEPERLQSGPERELPYLRDLIALAQS